MDKHPLSLQLSPSGKRTTGKTSWRKLAKFLTGAILVALVAHQTLFPLDIYADLTFSKKISSNSNNPFNANRFAAFSDNSSLNHAISTKPQSFFDDLRSKIDQDNATERCARYGFSYNAADQRNRRIFYGALIASEPSELFHIISAEAYGIFEAMVYVESNRTQMFHERPFMHLDDAAMFQQLFGVNNVSVRAYVNENEQIQGLTREQYQRDEILRGWKDMGMQPDDIGYLSDSDEVFSRDYLIAMKTCEIEALDYEFHKCNPKKGIGLRGFTQVYESSPECITAERAWFHPNVMIGHCVEGIGNETLNPKAERNEGVWRKKDDFSEIQKSPNPRFPLYNGADFRRVGATTQPTLEGTGSHQRYTAFHFHNFFTTAEDLRFKYFSYGHPDKNAYNKSLYEIHPDIGLATKCVKNVSDEGDEMRRVEGGFRQLKPFRPIFFEDDEYRRKRHEHAQMLMENDEASRANTTQNSIE